MELNPALPSFVEKAVVVGPAVRSVLDQSVGTSAACPPRS